MPRIVGYMRCAVCGIRTDVKENKNGTLYANCANYHQMKMNKIDSSEAKAALLDGKQWNNGLIYLYPLKRERINDYGTATSDNSTGTDNAGNFGRIDGQPSTAAGTSDNSTGTDDDIRSHDDWEGDCGMF